MSENERPAPIPLWRRQRRIEREELYDREHAEITQHDEREDARHEAQQDPYPDPPQAA